MRDVYFKRGRVVRWEQGHLIHVAEAGQAIETEQDFVASPLCEEVTLPELDFAALDAVVRRIEPFGPERLIITEGIARHECNGTAWSERTRRIHVAIAAGGERALIDLASFDLDSIERAVDAMSRIGAERTQPSRLVVAQAVGAALIPFLGGLIELEQSPAGHDGKGLPVVATAGPPWPNWFRPGYRSRPVQIPLNLRAIPFGQIEEPDLPEAIALLGPIASRSVRLLCVDGHHVFPAVVALRRPEAVTTPGHWFPYGGGSLGARMLFGESGGTGA